MSTRVYRVEGMSCQHCVNAITSEVTALTGVTGVTVDLAGGTVAVAGDSADDGEIRAAIGEAGYTVVG